MTTVLIVDDSEHYRDMHCAVLEAIGATCLTATNGKEALAIIRQIRVDLVVTDLMMPEMDGFQLISEIMSFPDDNRPPAIVVSSSPPKQNLWARLSSKSPVTHVLPKPVGAETLVLAVKSALAAEGDRKRA